MNIVGVGTDIVKISRIDQILSRYPVRFPQRILHPQEQLIYAEIKNKVAFLAKRFAAKEAVSKALGCGFANGIYAADIFIHNNSQGCPQVDLTRQAGSSDRKVLISIADENEYAIAYAVALHTGEN